MAAEAKKRKASIGDFVHSRFVLLGVIMGIIIGLSAIMIIWLSYTVSQESKSNAWFFIFGIVFSVCAILSIVAINVAMRKMSTAIIQRIQMPLYAISDPIVELSCGNLNTSVDYDEQDEFAPIANSTKRTIDELKTYIGNISELLSEMSNKNMDLSVDVEYVGDFVPIREAIEQIIISMNDLLYGMQGSLDGIRNGADNMADTANSIAEGATVQTQEIQSLVSHINQITENVTVNATDAEKVANLANDSVSIVQEGNGQMNRLLQAMDQIKRQSDDIASIISVIDAISEQTQLLSLNASIEAARAGEQGKGFAVVADEIGKLANECGEAAASTSDLINKTIEAVNEGGNLADETANILKKVVASSEETSVLVKRISDACSRQENDLQSILKGIRDIEGVVSENASASQESAAISEELLSMVESVEAQIGTYRFRANGQQNDAFSDEIEESEEENFEQTAEFEDEMPEFEQSEDEQSEMEE